MTIRGHTGIGQRVDREADLEAEKIQLTDTRRAEIIENIETTDKKAFFYTTRTGKAVNQSITDINSTKPDKIRPFF